MISFFKVKGYSAIRSEKGKTDVERNKNQNAMDE
jgi:hypothetical protein